MRKRRMPFCTIVPKQSLVTLLVLMVTTATSTAFLSHIAFHRPRPSQSMEYTITKIPVATTSTKAAVVVVVIGVAVLQKKAMIGDDNNIGMVLEDDPWIQQNLQQIYRMSMGDIERELRQYHNNVIQCNNVCQKEELVYQLLRARIQRYSRDSSSNLFSASSSAVGGPPYERLPPDVEQQRPPPAQEYYYYYYHQEPPPPMYDTRTYYSTSSTDHFAGYSYYPDENGSSSSSLLAQPHRRILYNNNHYHNNHDYNDNYNENAYRSSKPATFHYYPTYHAPPENRLDPVITTPLFFASEEQPLPIILLEAHTEYGDRHTMALLVDTSSSGSCLRPSVVRRTHLPISTNGHSFGTGTAVATGSTRIHRWAIGNTFVTDQPFDVTIENIGTTNLPLTVDGILGMSFLDQFDAMELDFANGVAHLYTNMELAPHRLDEDRITIGRLTRMGIHPEPTLDLCTAGVRFDGKGPVPLLVSTATTHSLLTWKGVDELGLSRHSNEMTEIGSAVAANWNTTTTTTTNSSATGGSSNNNNVVSHFTHRVNIFEKVELGNGKQLAGESAEVLSQLRKMTGIDCRGMTVDVGHFPMAGYSQLRSAFERKNIGGILGMDILSKCSVLRISVRNGMDLMEMYKYPILLQRDDDHHENEIMGDDGRPMNDGSGG